MLPDPRRYGGGKLPDSLLKRVDGYAHPDLAAALRALAEAGLDNDIRRALAAASSPRQYAALWRALCAALEKSAFDEAVAPRVFAMPWVIVAGGAAPASVACVLPDLAALSTVFDEHHVFGPSRTVGLSNALGGIGALESLTPSQVLHGWGDPHVRGMAPSPIAVLRGVEEVHVRFLLGAAITPAHAPSAAETGSNIGAWGTPALRAMAAQLATPNVQLLPMPRPPAGLYTAAYAGRRAGLETAFNLFMSNAVRRIRMAVGDPSVTLSAHATGEIRVVLWTPFDDALVEGFSWPLHPADDLAEVEAVITAMAAECQLAEPTIFPTVLPDRTSSGALLLRTR